MRKSPAGFNFTMTKNQLVLGLVWLPMHLIILPVILALLALFYTGGFDIIIITVVYFALSFTYLTLVMLGYLKSEFYTLAENKLRCLFAMAGGWMLNLMLSALVTWLLELLAPGLPEINPNQEVLRELSRMSRGALFATAVCFGPVIEEILYRGCLFGAIRRKSRFLAYVVSALVFSLIHVLEYAIVEQNPSLLLYVVQYIPVSVALAWCYERSGSLWAGIFLHMIMNSIAFSLI